MPLVSWISAHRRRLAIALVTLVALVGLGNVTWRFINSRTAQLVGTLVARVETAQPVIALTFDDGPREHGPVLKVLAAQQVPATFFVCGQFMESPVGMALARQMVVEGHELGNHSYSHQRMILKTPGWVAGEIASTDRLIRSAGHRGAIHFRPPYGKKFLVLPFYLAQHGRTTIMWDVEPETYLSVAYSPRRIIDHVVERTRPGSIILLHGAYPATQVAVGPLVTALKAKGFRFVTVSQLLAVPR